MVVSDWAELTAIAGCVPPSIVKALLLGASKTTFGPAKEIAPGRFGRLIPPFFMTLTCTTAFELFGPYPKEVKVTIPLVSEAEVTPSTVSLVKYTLKLPFPKAVVLI